MVRSLQCVWYSYLLDVFSFCSFLIWRFCWVSLSPVNYVDIVAGGSRNTLTKVEHEIVFAWATSSEIKMTEFWFILVQPWLLGQCVMTAFVLTVGPETLSTSTVQRNQHQSKKQKQQFHSSITVCTGCVQEHCCCGLRCVLSALMVQYTLVLVMHVIGKKIHNTWKNILYAKCEGKVSRYSERSIFIIVCAHLMIHSWERHHVSLASPCLQLCSYGSASH